MIKIVRGFAYLSFFVSQECLYAEDVHLLVPNQLLQLGLPGRLLTQPAKRRRAGRGLPMDNRVGVSQ